MGRRSDAGERLWRRAGVERSVAAHPHQRAASRPRSILFHCDHCRGLYSAVYDARGRRPDLRSDGAHLRLCAGGRADRDIHGDAMPDLAADFGAGQRGRDHRGARVASRLHAGAALVAAQQQGHDRDRIGVPCCSPASSARGSAANSCRRSRKAISGSARSMPPTISLEAGMPIVNKIREILLRYPEVITVVSQQGRPDDGSDAAGFFNAEFFVPLKPFDEWPQA